jgi:hypothetical protein
MSGQFVDFGGIQVDVSQLNLSDTSSRVADIRITSIVLISLVVTVVSLRLFARTRVVKQIFADDGAYIDLWLYSFTYMASVLIVLAAVLTLALASTTIAGMSSSHGRYKNLQFC